jgi:choline dehydrogenase-like flavoprotein/nucleoside-diphosphate-sugar epimerase
MPLIDLRVRSASGVHSPLRRSDVCIIGSGPAGATIAAELAATGLAVTILESGDFSRRADVDELSEIDSVGATRHEDQWAVRNRIVGGSSHTWGGRSAPFDEIDFERRSWVPGSGWPYGHDELAPYLERSAVHLGLAVGDGFSDERFWELARQARLPVTPDPALIRPFYWQFSRDPNETYPFEYRRFGRDIVARLGAEQTLVTGANVVRIETIDSGAAVRSVVFTDPQGQRHVHESGVVVLCTGGIENARILLASNTANNSGLGNDYDLVGRYLMDHPRGPVARFAIATSRPLQLRLLRFNVRDRLFRAGFRLSPELQREEGLLNASAWLHEVIADDDPWGAIRRLVRDGGGRATAAREVARGIGLISKGVPDYFVRKVGVPRKLAELQLLAMCEQLPDPDSRVTLSDRLDRFGVPIPRVDWRLHPEESRSVRRIAQIVAEELERMGFPSAQLEPWVLNDEEFSADFTDVAHPSGTTRMAANPLDGVVDAWGMVHGVDGLYVAGSSIFPTAGHANPTQMIVATAIRTADAIRARPSESGATLAATSSPRRVLVTGASGRIGRVLVPELLARGYLVRATSTSGGSGDETDGVEWRSLDFMTASAEDVSAAIAGCDAVIHLAASIGAKERMPRVNAEGTRMLVEAAEKAGVAALCYASTVSVYGSPRRRDVDENSPVLSLDRDVAAEYLALDYVREYGRTKLAGERAIHDLADRVRYVVLRPAVVVDVDQIISVRDWSTVKRYLGAHRHTHQIYVHDVVDAMIWSVERGLSGVGPAGGVDTFDLAEDDVPDPRYVDFMRAAAVASGDGHFVAVRVPGIFDWAHDLVRFRTLSTRNPLWRIRFSSGKIRAAGWKPRYGVAYARRVALDRLRSERGSA